MLKKRCKTQRQIIKEANWLKKPLNRLSETYSLELGKTTYSCVNVEHCENLKERFAVAGVETPEERLMSIAVMCAHLLTLLLRGSNALSRWKTSRTWPLIFASSSASVVVWSRSISTSTRLLSDLAFARPQPL